MTLRFLLILLIAASAHAQGFFGALLRENEPSAAAGSPIDAPLDSVTGATNAWSVVGRLKTSYSGNLFDVVRSSDGTSQSIGMTAEGRADESALSAFVGAGSGFVTKIYDHLSTNDFVQSDTNLAAMIVVAGTIVRDTSNVVTLLFDGANDFYLAALPAGISDWPVSLVAFADPSGASSALFSVDNPASPTKQFATSTAADGTATLRVRSGGSFTDTAGATVVTNVSRFMISGVLTNDSQRALFVDTTQDGASTTTFSFSGIAPTKVNLGRLGDSTPSSFYPGKASDWVLFTTAISDSDRTTLMERKSP